MGRHKSLYYPVLACAASHVFLTDATWGMQDLALTYYSKALRELSTLLSAVSEHENHNALLMSVILLYLHGVSNSMHLAETITDLANSV